MAFRAAQNDSRCEVRPEWGAFVCFDTGFVQLSLSSLDGDKYSRRLSPLTLASQEEDLPTIQQLPAFQVLYRPSLVLDSYSLDF